MASTFDDLPQGAEVLVALQLPTFMPRHLRDNRVGDALHKQDGRGVMPEIVNP